MFSGNFCEVKDSLCEGLDGPCRNGGTCHMTNDIKSRNVNDIGLGYRCFCAWGFSGVNCEKGKLYVLVAMRTASSYIVTILSH